MSQWTRREHRDKTWDGIPRSEILKRDGWICRMPRCLCPQGRVITPGLPQTDPWHATVDHVTPLFDGGTDAADNKRAAHAACNNRLGGPQGRKVMRARQYQVVLDFAAAHPGSTTNELASAGGFGPNTIWPLLSAAEAAGHLAKVRKRKRWHWWAPQVVAEDGARS